MIKRSRRKYDLALKQKVIDIYETNKDTMSFQDLGRYSNLPTPTVKSMWQSLSKLKSVADSQLCKMRPTYLPALEKKLIKFIRLAREQRFHVTGSIILSEAVQHKEEMCIEDKMSKVSREWL